MTGTTVRSMCRRPMHRGHFLLLTVLAACAPRVASELPAERPVIAGFAASLTEEKPAAAPCPAIDESWLEPVVVADTRTIRLAEVLEPEEVRAIGGAVPPRFDIGRVEVTHERGPENTSGFRGFGWMGMSAKWIEGATSPEIEEPLRAWFAAMEKLVALQRREYLLGRRASHAHVIPPPKNTGGVECIEAAARLALEEMEAALQIRRTTTTHLRKHVESLPSRSAADELLLAYLLEDEFGHPPDPFALERPIGLARSVVENGKQPRELRARAAELLARLHGPDSKEFVPMLEHVLRLTKDDDLRIETLVKLAEVADGRKAEVLRSEIIDLASQRAEESWRLRQALAKRAQARLEHDAFELARDDALACARTVEPDLRDNPDPWGCATTLATALAELGWRVPDDATVPLPFLGPFVVAAMNEALDRFDFDQARRLGNLLLERLPDAAQGPEAIVLGQMTTNDPEERKALEVLLTNRYGPQSAWTERQRERLAWNERDAAAVEKRLAELSKPTRSHSSPAKDAAGRRDQLRERGSLALEFCAHRLGAGKVVVDVDTAGTTPKVVVRGAQGRGKTCLQHAAAARFRSVGPARVRFSGRVP